MGIAIPQLAPASEDRVSGALVVDGSLRFDDTKTHYLTQTIDNGTSGFTISCWMKPCQTGNRDEIFDTVASTGFYLYRHTDGSIRINNNSAALFTSNGLYRDTSAFYNIVFSYKPVAGSTGYGLLYVNGKLDKGALFTTQLYAGTAKISSEASNDPANYYLGQWYLIDGQALGPEYFGYTDPLTNTWRPKKFKAEGTTVNDGTDWSGNYSGNDPGTAFDGTNPSQNGYAHSGSALTITFPKPLSGRIIVYGGTGGGGADTYTLSDGSSLSSDQDYASSPYFDALDFGEKSDITSLTCSAGYTLHGVSVDGVMLVDSTTQNLQFGTNGFYLPMDGNSPIGQDQQPSPINDGTVWSNFLTSSGSFDTSPDFGFDGIISGSNECRGGSGDTLTFTPPGGINYTSKVEVYNQSLNNQASLNGGTPVAMATYSTWHTIATGSGTINTMVFSDTAGNSFAFGGIRVDGVVLVDSQIGNSWTPKNFGGSNSIEKATGALPILNTTNGGTVARPGVFGSDVSKNYTITVASVDGGNRYALDGVDRPNPTLYRGGTYTFDYTAASGHPLYLSSLPDGKHNSKAYSVQFDGTDDRLAVGTSSDYAFGTGDFTIEMFIYHTDLTGQQTYFSDAHGDNNGVYFYKDGANALSLYDNNNNVFSAGLVELNKWHHIALSRSGGVVRGFIDGAMVAEVLDGHNYTETQYNIGDSHGSSSGEFIGYISNVRVLKGSALYIANFTPPTTTLTNITNTVLLCCQDSDDETAAVIPSGQSITAAGDPAATNSHNPFLYNNVHGNFGVNTATSNVTKITIPHYASDLYYYCNQHPNMGNTTAMSVVTDTEKADPYAWKCTVALPCIGNANDVSHLINCNTTELPIVPQADAHADFSTGNFYGGSYDLDNTGDYININSSSPYSHVNFGYGDYTAECWVYLEGTGDEYVFNMSTNHGGAAPHWNINFYSTNLIRAGRTDGNGDSKHQVSTSFPTNTWMHIAVSRGGGTSRLFLDGVLIDTQSDSDNIVPTGNLNIGAYSNGGNELNGFVQDARIYNGVAKYTSSFIPASTNPDILPDSPSGVAVKSQLTKITDGAVFIDRASNEYLQVPSSTDYRLDGQYCIEFFLNLTDYSNDSVYVRTFVLDGPTGDGGSTNIHLNVNPSNGQLLLWSGSSQQISPNAYTFVGGGWHHVCVTRDSSNRTRLFIDGVLGNWSDIGTDYNLNNNQNRPRLGALGSTGGTTGHYSNWRIIKGSIPTEYQTSTSTNGTRVFSPPTAALTTTSQGATANDVKLIACQSNTSSTQTTVIPDLTNFPAPYSATAKFGSYKEYTTVNRNATSGTTLPMSNPTHYGGKALDLGSGGFQITTVNSAAEDFFMGMWVHFDTYETSKQFGVDIAGNYVFFETISSGEVKIRHVGDGGSTSSGAGLNDGNWHHIALSRTNDTLYGFVDGTAVVSDNGGTSGNSVPENAKFNFWGADNNFTSYNIDGQIIDAFIYIGKGVSSYTNPTAPLVGNDGTINHFSGFTDADAYYISPCVDITGSEANSVTGSFTDVAGASTGTATNFNPFNTDINTVRGQEGDYCTLNPLSVNTGTFSRSNLRYTGPGSWKTAGSTMSVSTGKWYYEVTLSADPSGQGSGGDYHCFGFGTPDVFGSTTGPASETRLLQMAGTGWYKNFSGSKTDSSTVCVAGDVLSIAVDLDANTFTFRHNNNPRVSGTIGGTAGRELSPTITSYNTQYDVMDFNFGQKPFKFPPPDGFQPLTSSTVRPDTVIARPEQFVKTVLYTATGSDLSLDVGFQPDFSYFSRRNSGGYIKYWFDSVRGATKYLATSESQSSNAEGTDAQSLKSFNSNGVTIGNNAQMNENSSGTYASWHWKAGGNAGTFNKDDVAYVSAAAAGLTAGDVAATGSSVGTKQGFSIVSYTGGGGTTAEIPHGLEQSPNFVIIKNRDGGASGSAGGWYCVYHDNLYYKSVLSFGTFAPNSTTWNNHGKVTGTTSTVVQVADGDESTNKWWTHNDGSDYIMYSWHNVPGLQKFGSFTGNGNADGTYIDLGFKPGIIWLKENENAGNWWIYDSERSQINPTANIVWMNRNLVENSTDIMSDTSSNNMDMLSNGFKLRSNKTGTNRSGGTYIYCAWAAAPAFNLYGATSTAR